MVRCSRGSRHVLSGRTCQERLRYSREEDPLIFYSSPDVSTVLWKTRFLWIHHLPILPSPQNSWNTSKAVARGGWGTITSTLSRFLSVSLLLQHPAEPQRRSKVKLRQIPILESPHAHNSRKQTRSGVKWSVFEMFCQSYSAMCMICTSVFRLSTRPHPVRHPLHMLTEDLQPNCVQV